MTLSAEMDRTARETAQRLCRLQADLANHTRDERVGVLKQEWERAVEQAQIPDGSRGAFSEAVYARATGDAALPPPADSDTPVQRAQRLARDMDSLSEDDRRQIAALLRPQLGPDPESLSQTALAAALAEAIKLVDSSTTWNAQLEAFAGSGPPDKVGLILAALLSLAQTCEQAWPEWPAMAKQAGRAENAPSITQRVEALLRADTQPKAVAGIARGLLREIMLLNHVLGPLIAAQFIIPKKLIQAISDRANDDLRVTRNPKVSRPELEDMLRKHSDTIHPDRAAQEYDRMLGEYLWSTLRGVAAHFPATP